ncbi:DUF3068 domain-containing protein [Actinomadura litoris]|uniref:DUF3068 domain-containing protein n=1 Tax=Actinomadura litoris TaxID=2678616 RepID=UPI001FA7077F|nr:DUF3068 domain-containing protein [Actinomadura litoris]
MRRSVGLVLVAVGAFFLTLAPLVRYYVADRVAVAPLNRYETTRLEASNAAYFDGATLKLRNGVSLVAINTIRGDVRANGGDDRIAVWDSTTNIYDSAAPGRPVQLQGHRIAFDRRTARLVNCCGANADGDNTVRMSGYGLLFPRTGVHRRDYPFFDMATKRPAPMRFNGVEEVRGLTAYRFTQHVPLTRTAALDTKVPARLLGLDGADREVDRYTEAYNTVWVDPRTGIPVKHRENVRATVQTPDGKGRMVVTQADFVTVPQDQRALVDTADATAIRVALVRAYVPAGAVVLGLVLLLVGGYFGLVRGEPSAPSASRRPDGRFGAAARA